MSATAEVTEADIAESEQPSALASVLEPSTPLAIWRRPLVATLRAAAEAVCAKPLAFSTNLNVLDAADAERFRAELIADAGAQSAPLADDLVALACVFMDACGTAPVRIRLETVEDGGCRRFHFDNVAMRLVVTYRGSGTQWVSPQFAAAAHAQQTAYNGPVNEMNAGDIAVFRGKKSGLDGMTLHRSPQLEEGAPPRLIAVIDGETAVNQAG